MLDRMRQQIDKSLDIFMARARKNFRLDLVDPILYASLKEYVLRKGKRIRPLLLILSYKGYSTRRERMSPSIYYVSSCIELLHNFMLIHDDIIDRADLRRGKPTMHRLLQKAAHTPDKDRLGSDLSIIAGDIVYALAIDAFLSVNEDLRRKEIALRYFIQTAVFTAMGEFVDTLHGVQPLKAVTEKDVYLNYSLKTARYTFDCPLVVGAILAGAANTDVKLLSDLGTHVGQAFQVQDDIIGIYENEKNIGKSILSDIAESKKTLLVSHAQSTLKGRARSEFIKLFNKPEKTYKDLLVFRKIFIEAGSLDYSLKAIDKRLQKARKNLSKLAIKDPYRKQIHDLLFHLFSPSQKIKAAAKNGPGIFHQTR